MLSSLDVTFPWLSSSLYLWIARVCDIGEASVWSDLSITLVLWKICSAIAQVSSDVASSPEYSSKIVLTRWNCSPVEMCRWISLCGVNVLSSWCISSGQYSYTTITRARKCIENRALINFGGFYFTCARGMKVDVEEMMSLPSNSSTVNCQTVLVVTILVGREVLYSRTKGIA